MAENRKTHVTYRIVEHDGGWAYKVGDVFSETFTDHDGARRAAERAAREQRVGDQTHDIEYEDENGNWVTETSRGNDRPETDVKE